MKKILSLIFLFALCFTIEKAGAQVTMYSGTQTLDTVVNTAAVTFVAPIRSYYSNYSIQITATKISGTVAGTIALVYSNDGTNYFTIPTDSTTTAADTSGYYGFQVRGVTGKYIGVRWTGTGTMSASMSATIIGSK